MAVSKDREKTRSWAIILRVAVLRGVGTECHLCFILLRVHKFPKLSTNI